MAAVELDQVRKVYENGHVAVAAATFVAGDGELLVLVGPSGCGKTTTLRMIAGLESITSGTLSIGGRVVNDVAAKDRDMAMVFQSYALYPHMTVAQNLAFGLKLRGEPHAAIAKRVGEAAELLGITELLDRRPRVLSGGQRQRVALGRALVRQPQVFLLDEPLSNLDARLRLSTRVEIARLHRRLGTTMIYVTHDQIEAMTLGQRIAVFDRGEIQQIDTPMNLYARPANVFVAGFIGSPAMNLLRGRLRADGGLRIECGAHALPIGNTHAEILKSRIGQELIIGIRPEAIGIVDGAAQIDALLEVIEPVGNEIFLNLSFAGSALVMRTPPRDLPPLGSRVSLGYASESVHFFDAETQKRIN